MDKITEGRRANALKMLSQMHAYLTRYNDLDKTEEHFRQRVEELGGTDLYAIVDAVLDVVETAKKADKARMLRRVYRKYFPRTTVDDAETDQDIMQDLDNAEGPQWPEEISMRTAEPDEIGGEGDYFSDDEFEMDEPDGFSDGNIADDEYDEDGYPKPRYEEAFDSFIAGTDSFSLAYDDADEFLNDGWPRDQVEAYIMTTYKDLTPEDIEEIVNSVPVANPGRSGTLDQDFEHPVEEF